MPGYLTATISYTTGVIKPRVLLSTAVGGGGQQRFLWAPGPSGSSFGQGTANTPAVLFTKPGLTC